MKVYYHPYTLKPRHALGSLTGKQPNKPARHGALLRVHFAEGWVGFADCFPWPELGDLPLIEQLSRLKQGLLTPLTQRSFSFARVDGEARSKSISLFTGLSLPHNHTLLTSVQELTPQFLSQAAQLGFRRVKLKCGLNLSSEIHQLKFITPDLISLGMKLRLDFNHALKNKNNLDDFLKACTRTLDQIEFIEDPYPFCAEGWAEIQSHFGVELALDQLPPNLEIPHDARKSFSVWVIKPAAQDPLALIPKAQHLGVDLVITSYLDHPLGQLSAAWVAASLHSQAPHLLRECGLLSQTAYEPHPASHELFSQGPKLLAPQGYGLGLDSFLSSIHWEPLYEGSELILEH